jgi:hypothetical protein
MSQIGFAFTHAKLAKEASKICFLQPSVILAQWIAEGGQHNNFANITYVSSSNNYLAIQGQTYGYNPGTGTGFNEYATPHDGMLAYASFMNNNSRYSKCEHCATVQETCSALNNSGWTSTKGGYGAELLQLIVQDKLSMYDAGYNNVAGNPNVKPKQSTTANESQTPTSYVKRPQQWHKGLTPPTPTKVPSAQPTAKKKITSSAGALAKGTKNNTEGIEKTTKIMSLSFVGIVAILYFIHNAFIPTETL